jgi:hypothetical protein
VTSRWWGPWWIWLMAAGAIIGAALVGSIPAQADPITSTVASYAAHNAGRVCAVLDTYPTFAGVEGVLDGIQKDSGFTGAQTAQVIVLAVDAACPRHLVLLQNFADTFSPTGQGAYA